MTASDAVHARDQLRDDLKLQAWLALAEARNPSLHERVAPLAQARDDLRLQLHLGKMEATDAWHHAEERWQHLRQRLDHAIDGAEKPSDVHDVLDEIRSAYHRFRGDA